MIIDPPSLFAPLSEWEKFRDDMADLVEQYPESDEPKASLREALEWIAEIK